MIGSWSGYFGDEKLTVYLLKFATIDSLPFEDSTMSILHATSYFWVLFDKTSGNSVKDRKKKRPGYSIMVIQRSPNKITVIKMEISFIFN